MYRAGGRLLLLLASLALLGAPTSPPPVREQVGYPVPGVVALVLARSPVDDPYHGQFCAGVLVAPDTVLTAAHCVRGRLPRSIGVIIEADNLCRGEPIDGTRLDVSAIYVHPSYDQQSGRFDLAELTLAASTHARPRVVSDGSALGGATAYGWGGSSDGMPTACRLHRARLRPVATEDCPGLLAGGQREYDAKSMICALPEGSSNTCHGDSGGPVIAGPDADGSGPVIALVSWGRGCDGPGAYARSSAWPFRRVPGIRELPGDD